MEPENLQINKDSQSSRADEPAVEREIRKLLV